jgi:cobalamin biosynthesis protein CobD/CbiB
MAWLVMISVLVVPTLLIYWLLALVGPLAQFVWSVLIVYLTMGFRHYSHYFTAIQVALNNGELSEARDLLAEWTGQDVRDLDSHDIARLSVENALITTHRHVFGVFLWLLLPIGPAGAVIYRLAEYLARAWTEPEHLRQESFGTFAKTAFDWIDWLWLLPSSVISKTLFMPGGILLIAGLVIPPVLFCRRVVVQWECVWERLLNMRLQCLKSISRVTNPLARNSIYCQAKNHQRVHYKVP